MLILTRTVRLPRTQQTPGTLSSVFHPKGFTSPPLTSAGEGGAGVGPVPAKRPLGPAAGCCSCQPGLQSTWGSSSANHRQELGLSALIAGLRLSLSTFKPPQPVGHPGPFLMGHLCGLIWYFIRRSLPSWFQRRVPCPSCVPTLQSTASPHARGHSKQFVNYLGATCPTLSIPRAFMPTSQLCTTLVLPDVQFHQLSAPDRGRAESSGVPGFKHSSQKS